MMDRKTIRNIVQAGLPKGGTRAACPSCNNQRIISWRVEPDTSFRIEANCPYCYGYELVRFFPIDMYSAMYHFAPIEIKKKALKRRK